MNRMDRISIAFLLAALGTLAVSSAAAAESFRAGAAAVDISPRNAAPQPPSIVAGGFLEARADRVHDPLFVRAVVLDDGGVGGREPVRIALAVVDSCMMPQSLLDEAKALAAKRCGIPVERMMVSATHTHAAPAAMGCLGTRQDIPYAARLPAAIAEAIVAAAAKLEPAGIGWASVDDWRHTHNRRWIRRPETRIVDPFGNPTGLAHMHPGYLSKDVIGPSGPVDPQLSVVSIRTAAGRPLAVFANYSQHYFGAPAVSADYFGHFCRSVAAALGEPGEGNGPFVCCLSQGTSGDLMWMDYGSPKQAVAIQDYAAAVARNAADVIGRIEHRDDIALAMAEKVLPLAYRVPDASRLAWARPIASAIPDDVPRNIPEVYAREATILHERQRTTVKLQAIRIGDLSIATLPNEVYALTGLKLRNRSPAAMHFNVSCANGAEGYIPPPEQHVLGGYTTWPARTAGLEVQAEPRIVETLVAALEEVTGRPARRSEDAHGPAARVVLDANPAGCWRLEDEDGAAPRNAVAGGGPARLTPGFAWYLPGVGAGTGIGAGESLVPGPFSAGGRINRAVHLAGGELVLPGPPPRGDATLVAWIWLGERSGASVREGAVCTGLTAAPLVARQDAEHGLRFALGDVRTEPRWRADDWHHVAVVRSDDTVRVFVDGGSQPVLTAPAAKAGAAGESLRLGTGLQGKIDEVALFDRPLSAAELAGLWRASGVEEQRAAAEPRRSREEAEQVRVANPPSFAADAGEKIAKLSPLHAWPLMEPPRAATVGGDVRFDGRSFAAFRGGRIAGRDDGLDGDWSVAFWFRSDPPHDSRPVAAYLFSRGPAGDRQAPGDHLGIGGTAAPTKPGRLILYNGNAAKEILVGTTVTAPGTWNHVVLSRSGRRVTAWLNGGPEPEIDGDVGVTAAGVREFFLGSRSDDFAPLEGHMAHVVIFDRAVSAAEAQAIFAAYGRPPGPPQASPPPAASTQPRSAEATRVGIRVPPGFRVELVAAEPDVLDPVAFDWDVQGRLWVVEMADYPSGMDGQGAPGGRVRVLTDGDGDGRYETSRLFADGLSFPNGILCWRDGAIVTAAPRMLLLRDSDGDGQCDAREVLIDGFMEGNQQLRVNGLRWGLDGMVWCASGGHHAGHGAKTVVTSRRNGREYALGSHDFRFDPDTGEIQLESGPSQYGRCRDSFGHWFGTQNANPLWHWVIADRALARNPHVPAGTAIRHVVGPNSPPVHPASPPEKRFHSFEQSGRYTSACGSTIYGDTVLYPAGGPLHAFTCEPFHNLVQHNLLADDGASFVASRPAGEGPTDFFASDDRWCRPVMARTGPDGCLWVADMYRFMIEHPDWLPPEGRAELLPHYRLGDDRGRIWRIVREDAPYRGFPAAVRGADTPARRVALLDDDNAWRRDRGQQLLLHETDAAGQDRAVPLLRGLAVSCPRPETRVQALCTLAALGRLDDALLIGAIGDPHPRVRERAVFLAEECESPAVVAAAVALANDPDAKVCLQLAVSCGAWPTPEAADALVGVAVRFADDPLFRTAVMSSALAHADRFAAGILAAGPAVAAAYREALLRQSLGRHDVHTVAAILARAVAAAQPERMATLDAALADLQRLAADPWTLATGATGPAAASLAAATAAVDRELDRAADVAADGAEPPERRFAAARLLARAPRTRDRGVALLAAWLVPQTDPAVQAAAVEALARCGAEGVPAALAAAWPGMSPAVRAAAVDAWLSRGPWASDLLDLVASGAVPSVALSPAQRDRLLRHPDRDIATRAKTLLAASGGGTRRDVVDRYLGALAGAGDAGRGREVFLRSCAACHRRGDAGRDVGPNLATVVSHAPERLLANILDPNADIQPGFQSYTCVLVTGEVVNGLLASENGGSVTMTLADGGSRSIARGEIDELVTANRSFMPEGVESTVTVDQMRDLLAFLRGPL
jgi:putative membrane-bound dehydrogenase-like protein